MSTAHSHDHSHDHDIEENHGHAHHIHGIEKDLNDTDDKSTTTTEIEDEETLRRKNVLLRLKIASGLCFSFFLVEVIGGIVAGSLAVLSDAAHLLADLAAFAVAIAASHIATLPASSTYTFGYKRMESLAALFSMACLAVVSVFLAVEAIWRMWPYFFPTEKDEDSTESDGGAALAGKELDVDGKVMSFIAAIGVVVNIVLAFVLGEHHTHLPGMDHDHSHDHGHGHEHSHGHSHGHAHNDCDSHDDDHHDDEAPLTEKVPLLKNKPDGSSSSSSSSFEAVHADELSPKRHHHHHHHTDCDDKSHTSKSSHHSHKRNINLHAAYLHVLGDLAQSVAVLIAGLVIWAKPTWQIVDPICTILFCILVFYSTISVMRSSISVLLEEVPPGLDYDQVKDAIASLPTVTNVHDLHIWSISHGVPALSVHATAIMSDDVDGGVRRALNDVNAVCKKFNIGHSTIQVQPRCLVSFVGDDKNNSHQNGGKDDDKYDVPKKYKKVIIAECATCGVEDSERCR